MTTEDDPNEPLLPDLIPADEVEARRCYETVRDLDPVALAALGPRELLLAWWSFFWLEAALHPDDAEVWPEEVAEALPLAAEALRRYEAGEIEDSEYYPAEAVRHRILHERAKASQTQPRQPNQRPRGQADMSET
ncbi:MAG: hypothetical protein KDN18_19420 [Verrucomicrobiae bacterium]|nr:hypothetical protein [Verrucomicrobiae bacterium]